jgi:S-adenosylmethionine:tRNA ribosyltransferase-isomerase
MLRPGRRVRAGTRLAVATPAGQTVLQALVLRRSASHDGLFVVRFEQPEQPEPPEASDVSESHGMPSCPRASLLELLECIGEIPLPPYLRRPADARDREDYQTVFAREPGAIAAPTAGLHFDHQLTGQLECAGIQLATITLHVGPGTFRPVSCDDPAEHTMDSERYHVPDTTVDAIRQARARGGRVIAVGTTTVRTLEAAADPQGLVAAGTGRTELFIRPGYRFRVVDDLLTNLHLPRSTLLMLVAALGGRERVLAAYREAIDHHYAFYSYGDAMLVRGNR